MRLRVKFGRKPPPAAQDDGSSRGRRAPGGREAAFYFKLLPISVKVVFSLLPTVDAAVMIVKAIREAISPYSMAVAPDSFRKNSIKGRMALSVVEGAFMGLRLPSQGFAIVKRTCSPDFRGSKGVRNCFYSLQFLTARNFHLFLRYEVQLTKNIRISAITLARRLVREACHAPQTRQICNLTVA
jgi:hypothetical protein